MLFNLEFDTGDTIEGYLIPDGFSEQPGIRVLDENGEICSLDCDQHRQAAVDSGRHSTGNIGFRLTEDNVPGITERGRLIIVDRKTGLLIYRRLPREETIHMRIFRLENRLTSLSGLDRSIGPHFQYAMSAVERFGQETALQAFHLNAMDSIYLSGRLLVKTHEEFLDKNFHFVTLITDPYRELAERIVHCRRFVEVAERVFGERDRILLGPMIEHFAAVDVSSPKLLRKALRSADEPVRKTLFAPLTKLLVTTYPEQPVTRSSLAAAMDMLSRFSVVGLQEEPETFSDPLAALIGLHAEDIPVPAAHEAVDAVADELRRIPEAEFLLELDLIIYHFVRESIRAHRKADLGFQNEYKSGSLRR